MFSPTNVLPQLPPMTLALTYDDGPGPRTIEIAEYLHDHQIRATFFVVGKHVRKYPDVVKRVAELGHTIGNHTDSHLCLPSLVETPDALLNEVVQAHRLIERLIGSGPFLFRAPGGSWSADVAKVLNGNDEIKNYVGHIHWSIEYGDYEIGSSRNLNPANPLYTLEQCRDNYLRRFQEEPRNGVVLLHDWSADEGELGERLRSNNRTLELTKMLVPHLQAFKFVALDEVLPKT